MLTFNDAEPSWEWYPTPNGYVEAPQEWLLFGGPVSTPLATPMRITRKVSGPLVCPSGGIRLELTWGEKDAWDEDVNDTGNKISNSFDNVPQDHEDNLPVQQLRRDSDKTEHRDWDRSPTVSSFCPLIKSKATGMPKQKRVSLRSSAVNAH